jgi:hypothetical protein
LGIAVIEATGLIGDGSVTLKKRGKMIAHFWRKNPGNKGY